MIQIGYVINNQGEKIHFNILLTADSKVNDRTIYMIYFQE